MTSALQDFLAARLPFPGLTAWCARSPDRRVAQQSYSRSLPPARLEQFFTRLIIGAEGLRNHQIEPVRLLGVPAPACPPGASAGWRLPLALVVENRPDLLPGAVQGALEAFTALEPG